MASDTDVKVWVVTDRVQNPIKVPCSSDITAEKLCVLLCKRYRVSPLTRTLFALRIHGTDYFLNDNREIFSLDTRELDLRIRYKVPRIQQLLELDEATYDYYFQQVRDDVRDNRIPEIKYPEHKNDLLGLGVTDMYRATIEDNLPEETVVKNYKKYIPKVIVKNHGPIAKKKAQTSLPLLAKKETNTVTFVKAQYLQKLHSMAPHYLSEEYREVTWRNGGTAPQQVHLHVVPFHCDEPGLRMFDTLNDEWTHVSTIEELVCMARGVGNILEIGRKKGTPLIFQFSTEAQLSSFLSICDGYYRLMVKWTFNLSNDDKTPSLVHLYRLRCHGPVGGAFSYRKLKEKSGNANGAYILRQCKDEYDVYYLDVMKNGKPDTYRLEYRDGRYIFNDKKYANIAELRADYECQEGEIYLAYCIPPSEYDQSQLLLCGEKQKKGVRIHQDQLPDLLKDNKSPRCIRNCEILYEDKRPVRNAEDAASITLTCKGLWKIDETNKLDIAYKKVKDDKVKDELKGFIDLASKWTSLQEGTIVKLYGITLSSPTAMVLEWIPYGPLDEYLRTKRNRIKPHHLKTVALGLARALWHLSESGVVHGHIRARRLLVAAQDDDRIVVKLACPSLRAYRMDDEPWIPLEFRSDMSLAKLSEEGDIWAFATTLWEVFTYGKSPCTAKCVLLDDGSVQLPAPARCPAAVWRQMLSCWHRDPHSRTRPQEIMRNITQMLHVNDDDYPDTELNVSENPMYSQGDSGSLIPLINTSDCSNGNYSSGRTISTILSSQPSQVWSLWHDRDLARHDEPTKLHAFISHQQEQTFHFVKSIGSGNYGKVWLAMLERENRRIAVKRFKPDTSRDDYMNELEIMKTLYHPNIVKIEGLWDDSPEVGIVMEYLELGSLDNFLKTESDINTCLLLKYGRDIASAMDYISAKGIVHRDLAARNILVADRRTVKISDFGLSRLLPRTEDMYRVRSRRSLPVPWYAPEASVLPYSFTTKSDVWSYGVTLWEMFQIRANFGHKVAFSVPVFNVSEPHNRAQVFVQPKNCPTNVYEDLMKICWELEPQRRPMFIDLVQVCVSLLKIYISPEDRAIDDVY